MRVQGGSHTCSIQEVSFQEGPRGQEGTGLGIGAPLLSLTGSSEVAHVPLLTDFILAAGGDVSMCDGAFKSRGCPLFPMLSLVPGAVP